MPGVLTSRFESLLEDDSPTETRNNAWAALLEDEPGAPGAVALPPKEPLPAFDPNALAPTTEDGPLGPVGRVASRIGRTAWERTTPGLASFAIRGEVPQSPPLPWYEDIAATVGSFVVDPLSYLTFGFGGGAVGKQVARQMLKKGATKGGAQAVAGAAGAYTGLGGYSAGQYPVRQAAYDQPYSVGEHLSETVTMGSIGAISATLGRVVGGMGGRGVRGAARRTAGLGTEIGAFGTLIPLSEERLPAPEDYAHAAGVILGIKATHAVGRGLWKVAKSKMPSAEETEAIGAIEGVERARIALVAKGLADGSLRINPETNTVEPVTADAVATLYKAQLLTPGGAAALLDAAPDVATRIGGETKPSRRSEGMMELRKVAPEAEVEKWSAKERNDFADMIRGQERGPEFAEPEAPARPVEFPGAFGGGREMAAEARAELSRLGAEKPPEVPPRTSPDNRRIQREIERRHKGRRVAEHGGELFFADTGDSVRPRALRRAEGALGLRYEFGEVTDAREIRGDEGQVGEARPIAERGEAPSREEVQRQQEAGRAEPVPGAQEEVGQARAIGRPELANPALTPEGRQFVDTVDEARKQAGIPAKVTFAEMEAEAGKRLEADYAGERGRLLEFARKGGTIPAEHLDGVVARQIILREELETIKTGDPARLKKLGLLTEAYRGTGTEYARNLAVRRDSVETPEQRRQQIVVEAIVQPRQKDLKKLEKAKRKGDEQAAERIRDKTTKEHEQLRKDLAKQGIDLKNIEKHLQDEHQSAAILRATQTLKGDRWDAMYEWWNNSILGAVSTQMANITGNTGNMGWYFTGRRLTEALVNTIGRNPKEAQWGEFPYMMAATLPGMSRAARNFFRSFDMELPVLERDFGKPGVTRFEVPRVTIRGTKGRIIRLSWRSLLAFDQLFKSFASEVETAALAYRRSKAAGLMGRDLQLDIARQVMDPTSEARSESIDTANRLAFMEPSEVGNALIEFRRKVPFVRYQIPFVTTPWNILKAGFRMSPAGTLPLSWKIYKGMKAGTWEGVTPRIAEQMIAWAAFLALLSNDPEEPFITGAAEERERGPREMSRRTHPSQSIQLPNGEWWSYARIEPFATALSLMVDFTNAFRSGDVKRVATVPMTSVVGQIKNKTFMKGIGDFFRMFESPDIPAAMARWTSSFLVSWVPNIIRTGGRSTRENYPERGVWGKGTDWLERLGKRTLQRTELGILPQEPGIDLWGRQEVAPKSPVPQTDWLWRMSMPVRIKDENIAKGDAVLLKWNAQHPDDPKYPGTARPTYSVDGKRKYMTDEQYTRFLILSGSLANDMVQLGNFDMEEPEVDDVERVLGIISKARSVVKKGLVAEWTGGRQFSFERLSPHRLYRDYVTARRKRRRQR